jgi:hypothetical protein
VVAAAVVPELLPHLSWKSNRGINNKSFNKFLFVSMNNFKSNGRAKKQCQQLTYFKLSRFS